MKRILPRVSSMQYKLQEVFAAPTDLLLDPSNPRLRKDAGPAREYSDAEIATPQMQERLFRAICAKEHEVKELSDSIKHHGYVNIDSIFVHRLPKSAKFLVIEGNRRTSAIKLLLANPDELRPEVRASLARIPVKELLTDGGRPPEHTTDFILSIRHIYGIKEWQPMQKAHSIHRAYLRLLSPKGKSRFVYESALADQLALTMNVPLQQVKKALLVYRIYQQLQELGYEVRSDHYSLIEIAVSQRLLADEFFELDRSSFLLSKRGADRFVQLCAQRACAVTNPAAFRAFATIYRNGTERDVEQVVSASESLDAVASRVAARMERRASVTLMEKACELLESIELEEIRGTKEELRLIERITTLLERKLTPAHDAKSSQYTLAIDS